jgi:hypothetical protein
MDLRPLALIALLAGPAAAADVCRDVFVPEGWEVTCSFRGGDPPVPTRVVVQPDDAAVGALNCLVIEPVVEPLPDPEAWLRRQVAVDVSELQGIASRLLDSESNPFAGTAFNEALRSLVERAGELGALPLAGCEEPEATAPGHRMRCAWGAGGVEQLLVLRLVEVDGDPYALRLRATSERRMRHLHAIANSFAAP